MKLKLHAGTTSKRIKIFVPDSSSLVGGGLTGLTNATSGLTAYYIRDGDNATTSMTLQSATLGTWTTRGFIVVDATNMPGVYEFGIPDAALAAGSSCVHIVFRGAANMVDVHIEIELDVVDYQDGKTFGLTAVSGNIVQILGSGVTSASSVDANVVSFSGVGIGSSDYIEQRVWNANIFTYNNPATTGSGMLGLVQPIYYADIELIQDTANTTDDYGVQWFRNAIPIGSGQISNPAYSVYNTITGIALLSNRTLNYSSSNLGSLSRTETTLTTSGVPYLVVASGTIDGAVRNWQNVVGKI